MTYLRNHNHRNVAPLRGFWIAAVVIIIAAFAVILFFIPHIVSSTFMTVAGPFWRAETAVNMGSLSSPQALLAENENLKRRLSEVEIRLLTISLVEIENAELKAAMGRASTTPYILAAVLKRPPLSAYDELVIDVGTDFGLTAGDLVYAMGSVPIGRIVDVFTRTSRIVLFSSPEQKYEIEIGSARTPATAIGRGGGQYQVELPRDINVSEGDLIVAPSITMKPFGIVRSVISDPTKPFQTILISPPESIYSLRWVWVERTSGN